MAFRMGKRFARRFPEDGRLFEGGLRPVLQAYPLAVS